MSLAAEPILPPPDFTRARFLMVEAQLRACRVSDPRVLAALGAIPREAFAPPALAGAAYVDDALPLTPGRYLAEPRVLARLLEAAELTPSSRVLDLAPGTGYSTVALARLAGEVVGLEPDATLAAVAAGLVRDFGLESRVRIERGPLAAGWAAGAPWDAILVNGAMDEAPQALLDQLAEGGRLLAVFRTTRDASGRGPAVGEAQRLTRRGGALVCESLFNAQLRPLRDFSARRGFDFGRTS